MKPVPYLVFALVYFLSANPLRADGLDIPLPWAGCKTADCFRIAAKAYPRSVQAAHGSPKIEAPAPISYDLYMMVMGPVKVGEVACRRIDFYTFRKPKQAGVPTRRYRICVGQDDGWPREASFFDEERGDKDLRRAGDAWVIVAAPVGLPVEILPLGQPGTRRFQGPDGVLVVKQREEGDQTIVEALWSGPSTDEVSVRQTWKRGVKWWVEYERRVNGRIDLQARLDALEPVPPPGQTTKDIKPYPFPLRLDLKLREIVQIEETKPKFDSVLSSLRSSTGLSLVVDPALGAHQPDLGYVEPLPQGWKAWQLMEWLQKRDLQDGRWDKTPTGYQLTGVSTSAAPPAPEPSLSHRYGLFAAAGIAIVLLIGGGVVVFQSRRRSPRPSA